MRSQLKAQKRALQGVGQTLLVRDGLGWGLNHRRSRHSRGPIVKIRPLAAGVLSNASWELVYKLGSIALARCWWDRSGCTDLVLAVAQVKPLSPAKA